MIAKSLILDFPACNDVDIINQIITNGEKCTFKKGDRITTPGDDISSMKYIYSGKIKVVMIDPYGYEKILYILHGGWFLREGLFLNNIINTIAKNYSIAEEESVIYKINKNVYDRLSECSSFTQSLLRSCAIKRALLVNELHSITFNTSEERVRMLFVASTDKTSNLIDEVWYPLKHQYTHQEMAMILGINRVTVSKVITRLCHEKTLRVINKKIQVNIKSID